MNHTDHVNLLKPAHLPTGGVWADLGAGSGAFTLALRELVGADAKIYAIDKDRRGLEDLAQEYEARFGDARKLQRIVADFSFKLELPPLDGVLMANSLHYFKDKQKVLRHIASLLKPSATLLLVEYNVDTGNPWVPYPLSFETFKSLAPHAGFTKARLLAKHPSSFLREFYSAIANKGEG